MPQRTESSFSQRVLDELLKNQAGVVSRRQLVKQCGASRADLRRLLSRGELVVVHPGVYVNHSGRPTRRQQEWAAVLLMSPAALHKESALDAHGMTRDRSTCTGPDPERIHLVVERGRRLTPPRGITIERVAEFGRWVQPNRRPARATFEYAALKAASSRDEVGAIALLSDAVHQGLTTADRLLATLRSLGRLPQRSVLLEILEDVAAGTRSVLEQRYLVQVERAHGLPAGERQVRQSTASGTVLRDLRHAAYRVLVELDGAFGHRDAVDRWSDLQRDLDAAVGDQITLRAGWVQVMDPCRLAALVGKVLQSRGWEGSPTTCGPDCTVDRGVLGPT